MTTDEPKRKGITPYAMCLLACDQVIQEAVTHKHSLIGVFSSIGAHHFPATHPRLAVYFAISDGLGEVPIRIAIVDGDTGERKILEARLAMNLHDPRSVAEAGLSFGPVIFPDPGEYRLQLFADENLLMERRIVLTQA